jgi:PTS system ascorbate-specific IIA component
VIGLAAIDHDAHSSALARIARLLADTGRLNALQQAASPPEIRHVIREYERA